MNFQCPNCGGENEFKSRFSAYAVCRYCGTMLVRQDRNIEAIGKMAELAEDMSPLQVGTTGVFDGKNFELLGRMRVAWEDGYWNEWYAYFTDGKEGWLGEAQGQFAMSFEREHSITAAEVLRLEVGKKYNFEGLGTYSVSDKREVKCEGSEGELPYQAAQGRAGLSIDLGSPQGDFASIELDAEGVVHWFGGKYVDFDDFNFKHLRPLDGWE